MPVKLKRHIVNWIRFAGVYIVIELILQGTQNFGIRPARMIEWGLSAVYLLVSGWFVWRAYAGMIRDCDFYEED